MLDIKCGKLQKPSAKLSDEEIELAKRYLQGAVHSLCKNNPGRAFALRDLVGGEYGNWNGNPLQKLYDFHIISKDEKCAKRQAAIDAGWLLKAVLQADKYTYEQMQGSRTKMYRKIS